MPTRFWGEGPIDLVYVMGWVSHLEAFWMDPAQERFFRRLAFKLGAAPLAEETDKLLSVLT